MGKATVGSFGHFKGKYKNGEIKMHFQKEFEPILSYFNKNKVFLPGMSQQLISYSGSKQSIGQANNTFASAVHHEIKYFMKEYSHFHVLSFSCAFIFKNIGLSNFHSFDQITLLPHEYLIKMNINTDEQFLSGNISVHCAAGSSLL